MTYDSCDQLERERVSSSNVVLYHSPYCGFSRRALDLLQRKGVSPEIVVALDEPILRDWLRRVSGQSTLPQVFIHGRSIGGYSELLELELGGELEEALAKGRM